MHAEAPPSIELRRAADKYDLRDLPEIDCIARIPLCGARCCRFTFALSRQDVIEGIVRWDPTQPYRILQRDGACTHQEGHLCSVYDNRPAICRTYDCRRDKRIWIDYDRRIPAADHSGAGGSRSSPERCNPTDETTPT
jgi:Fe-S-cluster containining protein